MTNAVEQVFNDPTLASLKLTLEAASARHAALASNIANVNTPKYHRVDLSSAFKTNLDNALHQMDQGKSLEETPSPAIVVQDAQNPARFDGNTVNVDQEMTEMIKNQTDFDFSARMLALRYTSIKDAITGKT